MSSNFVKFQEILNQALAENFSCLTQKLVNPPLKSGSSFPNRDPLFKILIFALFDKIGHKKFKFYFLVKKGSLLGNEEPDFKGGFANF